MTLQQFIAKYNGKVVADGQCGNLVRAYWNEVDLTNPPSYPNSKDYWFNPVPGYDKVHDPHPGDIAIYDGHGSFPEGHSAIYNGSGQVFEQNADPDGSPAHLFNRANTYLLGYLRKQGEPMSTWNNGDTYNKIYNALGRDAYAKSIADKAKAADYVGYFGGEAGKEYKAANETIDNSQQFLNMVKDAQNHAAGVKPYSGPPLLVRN